MLESYARPGKPSFNFDTWLEREAVDGMLTATPFSYEVQCSRCPLRTCKVFQPATDDELASISTLKAGELRTGPASTVLQEGIPSDQLFTLLEGWAFRYKSLDDGRRQITSFALPGDFLGIQGSMQGEMDHSVETLTPAVLCSFPRKRVWELFQKAPSLAFDITWLSARHESMLNEHLLSLGRRNAVECAAYYLLHLYLRADDVGLVTEGKVRFPFTQDHLADALGLSLVHTNKTLKRLSERGLVQWEHGWCFIPDVAALADIAKFDLEQPRTRPLL
jgi:CRP/FNR family transcriptional regulator, anaerobic regulatory protein